MTKNETNSPSPRLRHWLAVAGYLVVLALAVHDQLTDPPADTELVTAVVTLTAAYAGFGLDLLRKQ